GGEEASCEEGGQEEACQEGRQEGSTTGQARQEGACRGNPGGSCADDVITRSPINRHQAPFPHAQAEREFFYAPAEAGGWCRSPGAGARPGVEASARVRVRRRGLRAAVPSGGRQVRAPRSVVLGVEHVRERIDVEP